MSATDTTATTLTRQVAGHEVPEPGAYALDSSHSQVGFVVRHMMVSKVRGRFGSFSGNVVIAERPEDSSVEVSVDMASIDTREPQRDGHLRGPDFFNVDEHPTMTFRSSAVRADGDDWLVDGDLTITGVSRPLTLKVSFEGAAKDPWGGTRLGFEATGEINREDYGLTWNQALETGGFLVGKKVTLEIEAEAVLS